jgi:uncharacterized membrane protein
MQFDAEVLSPGLALACTVLAALLLLWALPGLRALRGHPGRLNLLLGAAVGLAVLWSLSARIEPGIALHLVGTPVVVLLLGLRLGMLAAALAALTLPVVGATSFALVSAGWLLTAALPGAILVAVAWTARFYLPCNPFVFIFVAAFFGSALGLLGTWLGAAAMLAWSGQPAPGGATIARGALLPLVMYPEAFLNGAVISTLVVSRPGWVRLYDERFYLRA